MDTMFNSRAGDPHTPNFGFHLGTPLSSAEQHPTTALDPRGLQMFSTQQDSHHHPSIDPQSFAPHAFVHRDSGYETVVPHEHSETRSASQLTPKSAQRHDDVYGRQYRPLKPPGEKCVCPKLLSDTGELIMSSRFRFFTTLNAPTAMIKDPEEIPITYLNKGQAYALSVNDTLGTAMAPMQPRYRTTVRISFEDDEQRQKPAACWQLWKEGRGSAESHQRGGKLQAVEFAKSNQSEQDSGKARPRIDLEMASFDSFIVNWTPAPGSTDCNIAVRFNFLSTDFSHSKGMLRAPPAFVSSFLASQYTDFPIFVLGVKGIPVRLCAKTELVSSATPESPSRPTAEVCYCKVKLFRDHGAERKLSNDIAHIKKTIEKLQQQISQIEHGVKDGSKRKRSEAKPLSHKPGKVPKHKRTWSVSSQTSSDRPDAEDDLHIKLASLQDMFSSTRPVSVLHLRGDEQDDPDEYPVTLPNDQSISTDAPPIERPSSWGTVRPSGQSTPTRILSPTSTIYSATTAGLAQQAPKPMQRQMAYEPVPQAQPDWEHLTHFTALDCSAGPTTKVPRPSESGDAHGWIEASGVDPTYQPPPEPVNKPVACFYVLIKSSSEAADQDCYRAVYLTERSVQCLVNGITSKCDLSPNSVVSRSVRINSKGLKVIVDEDVVGQIPEGQDMIVDFVETSSLDSATLKAEDQADGALEMRLHF